MIDENQEIDKIDEGEESGAFEFEEDLTPLDPNMRKGILYLVSTPIGNLKDISHRAIEILNSVETILCEDTRESLKLLNHYEVKRPLKSLHKFNELRRLQWIKNQLDRGFDMALISDAGTPLICDPGVHLIPELLAGGYSIDPIPGASAILPAVQLSGLVSDGFWFIGFLPKQKKDQEVIFNRGLALKMPLFFYESPHRIKDTLTAIQTHFGDIEVAVVREITKKFQRRHFGKISEIIDDRYKGELVVGFLPPESTQEFDLIQMAKPYEKAGFKVKQISTILAIQTGTKKRDIYELLIGK